MPVPSDISVLSQTPGSNSPAGSESPALLDDYHRTTFSFIAKLRDGQGFSTPVDLASAATTDIGAQTSQVVRITGATTITSLGTNYNGPRFLTFSGALTLTHNATSLILPGGGNITTAAGDTCIAVPNLATPTGWRIMAYERAAANDLVGAIVPFPATTPGPGWLKANGALLSRTAYAALWAYAQASGNLVSQGVKAAGQFGDGDGSTTFSIPDARGLFPRALDDGKGTDPARVLGSVQASQNASHNHTGVTTTDGSHTHGTGGDGVSVVAGGQGVRYWGDGAQQTGFSGSHNHTLSINASGGAEARPVNVAWLFCIKF